MRVVIVFPHVGYCTGWRPHLATEVKNGATYHIAQAMTYLYSIARAYTDHVRVVDFNFGSREENLQAVLDYRPDAVLISSTVNSYDSTRDLASAISQARPEIKLFVGGPAVSSNYFLRPELLKIDAPVEYIVTNKDIFAWAKAVFGENKELKFRHFEVDNRWIRETYPEEALDKIRYTVVTSIGCTYKCSFCLNPKVYRINYKAPEVLRREISYLQDTLQVDAVSVADPFFFMREQHAADVMDVLEERGIRWSQQTCLVTLTDENLKRMAETGCSSVLVGIENFTSGEINKPVEVETFEDRTHFAMDLGIKIKPSFISGLLDIDYETDVAQIHYIRSIIDRGLVENNQIQSNIYTPYIPDARDRLIDVPFRFWGVMPVTAKDEEHWKRNLALCDLIYEQVFPETLSRYQEVRAEYLDHLDRQGHMWLQHKPVPHVPTRKMNHVLTSGKVQVEIG
ncbi:B12-binding domain-containing radical SAM protein [Streptomyces sp. NPDC057555]|uniref:Radical SAM domain/B12 binding domain-containing protein n=1 Tax=Streptomyces sp. JCM 9888 TaxID=1570103 RepID=A0A0B5GQB3_9ACTN|nr:Radical SAM domain/B12 binding domain-containing protein [Streptomyces sp. JCM 9888]